MYKLLIGLLFIVSWARAAAACDDISPDSQISHDAYIERIMCLIDEGRHEAAAAAVSDAVEQGYRDYHFLSYNKSISAILSGEHRAVVLGRAKRNHRDFLAGARVDADIDRMYHEDQISRYTGRFSFYDDKDRVETVLDMSRKGQLKTGHDFYFSSVILMHGSLPAHFKHANELAKKAVHLDRSNPGAKFIVCASEDRYLLSQGKPQIWGTQRSWDGEKFTKELFDPEAKTDRERKGCW